MPLSREIIVRARQDYAAGVKTVAAICAEYEIGQGRLYFYVDGGAAAGELHFPPLPRRRDGVVRPRGRHRIGGDRMAVVARMWRTAEAQVREIEERLMRDQQQGDERERDARMLAVLVKTLRELTALDEAGRERQRTTDRVNDHDDGPRNLDEFRRELARKIDEIAAGDAAAAAGETA
jgi:hypothetical protein